VNQLEIESAAQSAIEELKSYFSGILDKSKSIVQINNELQREDLINYINTEISDFLTNATIDYYSKIDFLKIIQSRLESYFKFKDVINDVYRNNIITFYNSPQKYNYSNFLQELDILFEIFKNSTSDEAKSSHLESWNVFRAENYKLARIKLPYTNVNEIEIIETYKSILLSNNSDSFITFCFNEDWTNAPNSIKPFLNKILDYNIGVVKSSILWEILGYVLKCINHLESITITFENLFKSKTEYDRVITLFKENDIIGFNNSSMGIVVPGSIDKHTVASLIAIAEALTNLKLLKGDFTLVEKVRIMARSFNMKASTSSLKKKSPFHSQMVAKIRRILHPLVQE